MLFIYIVHHTFRPTKCNRNCGLLEFQQHICVSHMWCERNIYRYNVEERKFSNSKGQQTLIQWKQPNSTHQKYNQLKLWNIWLCSNNIYGKSETQTYITSEECSTSGEYRILISRPGISFIFIFLISSL